MLVCLCLWQWLFYGDCSVVVQHAYLEQGLVFGPELWGLQCCAAVSIGQGILPFLSLGSLHETSAGWGVLVWWFGYHLLEGCQYPLHVLDALVVHFYQTCGSVQQELCLPGLKVDGIGEEGGVRSSHNFHHKSHFNAEWKCHCLWQVDLCYPLARFLWGGFFYFDVNCFYSQCPVGCLDQLPIINYLVLECTPVATVICCQSSSRLYSGAE